MTMKPYFFQFEQDFITSLRCIPMIVRMKLDICGVKLKLHHWHQLDEKERQNLITCPCETNAEAEHYRQQLQTLLQQKTGSMATELPIDSQPAWLNTDIIPDEVQQQALKLQRKISLTAWQGLNPMQRFALIKLSRSNHENNNFLPALQEFGLDG